MGQYICKKDDPFSIATNFIKKHIANKKKNLSECKGFDGEKRQKAKIAAMEEKLGRQFNEEEITALETQSAAFIRKYDLGKRLSAGAQGVTYLATERRSGNVVVVKKPNDPNDLDDYNLLITKTHPNIVRVFEYFANPLDTYIVMECCAGGDLFGAMEKLPSPTQNWLAGVFQQVCRGTNYIHNQFGEAHCDLKPENILLSHKPRDSSDVPRAMVGDFGCLAPINTVGDPQGGDPRYRGPEIWQGYAYSAYSDVWALGVTLYEMVTGGLLPYVDRPNIAGWANFASADNGKLALDYIAALQSGVQPTFPQIRQPYLNNLITGMLQATFWNRWPLPKVLEHPWFTELTRAGAAVEHLSAEAGARIAKRARGNRLHMILLDSLSSKLQGQSLIYYRDMWDEADTDGDGILTYDEFNWMLEDTGLYASSNAASLWAIADKDQSGTISFQEFVTLMFDPDHLTEDEKMKYFRTSFEEISQGEEEITYEQMMQLFPNYPPSEIYQLFADVDSDRSGYISVTEFEKYLSSI